MIELWAISALLVGIIVAGYFKIRGSTENFVDIMGRITTLLFFGGLFALTIFFIIFDIEIMFLIPWCASISKLDLLGFWSMIDFLFELGVGFFYVWYVRALDWD